MRGMLGSHVECPGHRVATASEDSQVYFLRPPHVFFYGSGFRCLTWEAWWQVIKGRRAQLERKTPCGRIKPESLRVGGSECRPLRRAFHRKHCSTDSFIPGLPKYVDQSLWAVSRGFGAISFTLFGVGNNTQNWLTPTLHHCQETKGVWCPNTVWIAAVYQVAVQDLKLSDYIKETLYVLCTHLMV